MMSAGRAHQPHADHRPLAHAAGELVRVLPGPPLRARRPAPRAAGRRPAPTPSGGRSPGAAAATSASWPADALGRVERGHRVLEHHRQRGAEQPALRRGAGSAQVVPRNSSRSASTRPGSSISRAIASAVRLLPEPDSPTTPTASPRRTAKRDPADRRDRAGRAGERDLAGPRPRAPRPPRHWGWRGVGDGRRPRARRRRRAAPGWPPCADAEPWAIASPNRLNARPGHDDGDAGRQRAAGLR